MRRRRPLKRLALGFSLVVLTLAVSLSPARAAVTLGQLEPGTSPVAICNTLTPFDYVQASTTAGSSYVVPGTGTITSWSHNAAAGPGQQMSLKVFRPFGPKTYQVVGHDGPRPLTESAVNTFAGFGIPVKPGDVIGLGEIGATACWFEQNPGNVSLERGGDLGDGQAASNWGNLDSTRLNLTAVFNPSNSVALGAITRNRKKGTATVHVDVPNPGELTGSGNGAEVSSTRAVNSKSVGAGKAQLRIRAKGRKKRKLNDTGKVKLEVAITYTPIGGAPNTRAVKVKLIKR